MVSASGDAYWIVWDMSTGQELRRGGGDARGLACVVWKVGQIRWMMESAKGRND